MYFSGMSLLFFTILSSVLYFQNTTNNILLSKNELKSEIEKNKYYSNLFKSSIYSYCRQNDSNPSIDNFNYISNGIDSNSYRISYSSDNKDINISTSFEDQNLYNFKKNNSDFICNDSTLVCYLSFNMLSEDISSELKKSKCSYQTEDFDLDSFVRNTLNYTPTAFFDYKNSSIEDTLHINELIDSSSNDITDDTLSSLNFNLFLKQFNKIDLKNKSFSDISFLNDLNISDTAYIDLSSNDISDLTPLENKTFDTVLLNDNNISTTVSFNARKINLSNSGISDISFLDNASLLEDINISDNSVSDISYLSDKDLKVLDLTNTDVSSLSDISGIPLTSLSIIGSYIDDLTPICDITTLTEFNSNAVSTKCAIDSNFCSQDIINNNSDYCE